MDLMFQVFLIFQISLDPFSIKINRIHYDFQKVDGGSYRKFKTFHNHLTNQLLCKLP